MTVAPRRAQRRPTARSRWRRPARRRRRRRAAARRRTPGRGPARGAAPGRRRAGRRGARPARPGRRRPRRRGPGGGLQGRAAPPGRRGPAGRCRRRCRTAPAAPARRGRHGRAAGTSAGRATAVAVPADLARCWTPARPAPRAGWTCPSRSGRAAAPARRAPRPGRRRLAPRVPSSWTAVTPTSSRVLQRLAGAGAGQRGRAADQVDPGRQLHQVAAAGEPAGGQLPGAGARRLGDHRAGDPAEPVEPVDGPDTSSAVASPQPPAT